MSGSRPENRPPPLKIERPDWSRYRRQEARLGPVRLNELRRESAPSLGLHSHLLRPSKENPPKLRRAGSIFNFLKRYRLKNAGREQRLDRAVLFDGSAGPPALEGRQAVGSIR